VATIVTRLIVSTLVPPVAWFRVTRTILTADLNCGRGTATLVSLLTTFVAFIYISGLIGVGMNRHAHTIWFYVFLLFLWLSVPIGLWTSWGRPKGNP